MTNDPVSRDYVPAYDDPEQEFARLERCLQQQIEDSFTTISRMQDLARDHHVLSQQSTRWATLRGGLRCWRAAIRSV